MTIMDFSEEVVSDVDINLELNAKGISLSVFVDNVEIHDTVDYPSMAYMMVGDRIKYPDELLRRIAKELQNAVDILEEAVHDE